MRLVVPAFVLVLALLALALVPAGPADVPLSAIVVLQLTTLAVRAPGEV